MQPLWAAHEPQMDELTIPFLGDERAALQYPFGDLVAAGAHLAAGSDWPVSSPDPLHGAHVAVNRVAARRDRRSGRAPLRAQPDRPRPRCSRAYTAGSAWVNHLDEPRQAGSSRGLLADLAVLDRDPFAGPPEEIAATRPSWRPTSRARSSSRRPA